MPNAPTSRPANRNAHWLRCWTTITSRPSLERLGRRDIDAMPAAPMVDSTDGDFKPHAAKVVLKIGEQSACPAISPCRLIYAVARRRRLSGSLSARRAYFGGRSSISFTQRHRQLDITIRQPGACYIEARPARRWASTYDYQARYRRYHQHRESRWATMPWPTPIERVDDQAHHASRRYDCSSAASRHALAV